MAIARGALGEPACAAAVATGAALASSGAVDLALAFTTSSASAAEVPGSAALPDQLTAREIEELRLLAPR